MQKSNFSILKKLIGKIHLWGGLVSGIVVFIVSITGCLFVFEQEIRDFTQEQYRFVVPENGTKASLSLITLNLAKAFPDKKSNKFVSFLTPKGL